MTTAREAVVIGAGLAGAAVAASLAKRGFSVTVLDRADEPASGASALPAGLLAPHYSQDDNLLSRLTRVGVHLTLAEARLRLRAGLDWAESGVLQHRVGETKPRTVEAALAPWVRVADATQLADAGLPADAIALWHERAAWLRPAALVRAWLSEPGVAWRGGCAVERIERRGATWLALDADGQPIATANVMVVAAAHASSTLLDHRVPLHPVRGQVTWGEQDASLPCPSFPVNGNGHFIPNVPHAGGMAWFSGSTYGRDDADAAPRAADHASNLERLRTLLPAFARAVAPRFEAERVNAWSGVRCASPDRRPLVGELEPGLWVSTAMGSRGLTFSALCGEIVATRLTGDAPRLSPELAAALDVRRVLHGGQHVANRASPAARGIP